MAGFIIALIVLSPLWIALLYGFSLGVRALRISCGHRGEYTSTLRFLAINLCEPLVNTVLVTLLATRSGASPIALWLCTVPMAVLLIPARGLAFSDPFYRDQSRQILRRGLWRWGLNLLVFAGALGGGLLIGTGALGLLIGTIMLWFHVVAGRAQLDHDLATPRAPAPVSTLMVQATAIASRPAAPALAPLFAPPLPLDPTTALHCTLCHALAAPATAECPTCGLVFRSRVPAALRSLERYEVLRPLGDGGMSTVYLARGHADGKLCVLKTLASVDPRAAPWRLDAARCLQHEAELLRQFDHPHVARLLDYSSDGLNDFLVLEYVAGPTLEQCLARASAGNSMIRGAGLPPCEVLTYGRSVAETLCYLADLPQPVVHCDIKPANLILPPGGRAPVLIDFGGALYVSRSDQPVTRLDRYGTPGYAAPEQYAGVASPKSDVYSLAATLYQLLTGDDPGAHPLAFPVLNVLPADVAAVLEPALVRDPAARLEPRLFSVSLRELAAQYTVPLVAAAHHQAQVC